MATSYTIPNVVASENIRPFRVVTIDGDFTVAESDANEIPAGITTGATRRPDSANAAEAGDPVELQAGGVMRVEAGGNIAAGARVKSDADGAIVTVTTGASSTAAQEIVGIALEAAADGEIVHILWQPHVFREDLS